MEIKGYKAFNPDYTNRYGMKFEEQKIYTIEGPLKFGNKGNGFHFCERLEDTLRYFDAMTEDIKFAEVTSLSEILESFDEHNDYYDMYSARTIRIDRFIPREEIVKMYFTMPDYRLIRFIQGFRLTKEEIEFFKTLYPENNRVLNTISYYQENNKDAFSKENEPKIYQKGIIK